VILYWHFLKIDPKNPDWEERDRVVLSKGHGGIGYAPCWPCGATSIKSC